MSAITPAFRSLMIAVPALLALAGCATTSSDTRSGSAASGDRMSVAELSERYRDDPQDRGLTLAYANALRTEGLSTQAVSVLEGGMAQYPDDPAVSVAYAKALTAEGRFQQALNVVEAAIDPRAPDWNALSVKGAILDQMGRHEQARNIYRQALVIAPNEAGLEANMGLSYSMTNDLSAAESHLRRAVALPGANSRIRQNLALVIGLQGRFDEAETLFAGELPPDQVAANMDYVRSLLRETDRWQQIAEAG